MNPQDLTGRDLDLALTGALGYSTHFPMGWDDPRRIPELFAEIAARIGVECEVSLSRLRFGTFSAVASPAGCVDAHQIHVAYGSTPNEALARLLLMVCTGAAL